MTNLYHWSRLTDKKNKNVSIYLLKLENKNYIQIVYDIKSRFININIQDTYQKRKSFLKNFNIEKPQHPKEKDIFKKLLQKHIREIHSIPNEYILKNIKRAYNLSDNIDGQIVSRTKNNYNKNQGAYRYYKNSTGNTNNNKINSLQTTSKKSIEKKEATQIKTATKNINNLLGKNDSNLLRNINWNFKNVKLQLCDIIDLLSLLAIAYLIFSINFNLSQTALIILLGLMFSVCLDYFARNKRIYLIKYCIFFILFVTVFVLGILYE